MNKYIETKVKCEKTQEDGFTKIVAEIYLVDAMTFTEAESSAVSELAPYISGKFEIDAVKKSKISEVVKKSEDTDEALFKIKYEIITINEKTQKENRSADYVLIEAASVKEALKIFEDKFEKDTISDMEIVRVEKTPILGIIEHSAQ